MPNHITTLIKISDIRKYEEIKAKVQNLKKDEEAAFDFNTLIPMPKHIFKGNLSTVDEEKEGKNNCWYQWAIFNWGTKWNAYQTTTTPGEFSMQTAWSSPYPVIRELSAQYPDVEIEVMYADEDTGRNLGHYKIKDVKRTEVTNFIEGSEEAIRFACLVHGEDYEQYLKDIEEDNE